MVRRNTTFEVEEIEQLALIPARFSRLRDQELVAENRTPHRCARPGCKNLVDPVRSTRRYCSDACRQKAYRQRKTSN
jgi:hypothetical protein